jgi:protease-4
MMQKTFLRETAGVVMRAFVVVLTIVITITSISALYEVENKISDGTCTIAVLPVEGVLLPFHGLIDYEMVTTPETVESFMAAVEEDKNIKGVLVEINSPGGTPVASARIAEQFKNSSLPVVGLIGDLAASGGYMVAAATDFIIASPMSDVGSIGVNMSYVEESKKNEEDGLTYVQLTSAKFKDIGNPNRPITEEERTLLEADLALVHNEFVSLVATYREMDRDVVAELADGSSMPGIRALKVGLVDALGGRTDAKNAFAEILQISAENIRFCEYNRGFLPF